MNSRPARFFPSDRDVPPRVRPILILSLLLALPLWIALGGPTFALPDRPLEQSTATLIPASATPDPRATTVTPTTLPPRCASQTPSATPSPSPTSYRVFDARASLAASAPRVRPGESFTIMARGYSPFAYELSGFGAEGLRFTGVFTYSHPAPRPSGDCSLSPTGFVCRDGSLRTIGPIDIFAQAVALAPADGRARLCVHVASAAPFGSGHDSNPGNDRDCIDIQVLPAFAGVVGTLDADGAPSRKRIPGWQERFDAVLSSRPEGLADPQGVQPQQPDSLRSGRLEMPRLTGPAYPSGRRLAASSAQSTATPADPPSPTPTPTSTPNPTPTPTATTGPLPVCASPTSTASATATPTSVRTFDASLEAWSSAPAVWPGDSLSLVLEADLGLKWRIEGEIEGADGLRLTGAYTFTRGAGPPPRRCEIEPRAFRCWLDLPEAYFSGDEELYLDAQVAADAQPGRASFCARVFIEAPRGSGGDPVAGNDQGCVNVVVLPAGAPRPTPPGWTPEPGETPPGPETMTPGGPEETSTLAPPPRRLWLPLLRRAE